MTIKQAVKILKQHNKWRRGAAVNAQASPYEVGIAIDTVINHFADTDKMGRVKNEIQNVKTKR